MSKPTPTEVEITNLKCRLRFLRSSEHPLDAFPAVRVTRKTAQKLLIENMTYTVDGKVRWFQIKDIGLGICEVAFQPCMIKTTAVVKKFSFEE